MTPRERVPDLIGSTLMAASGLILGHVLSGDFRGPLVAGTSAVILALPISASLGVFFVLTRKKMGVLANLLLFLATLVVGLLREPHV